MSFLGLEKPVEYGHFQAFDPRMAQMVLNAYGDYISAARQDYLLGQEEIKDFQSKYGDFTSPIEKDVENWNNITINPLNKLLDEAYANGIDPLRNREFRNRLLAQARSVNGADLAKLKQSAETAKEYIKNRASLIAKGKFNPQAEAFVLNGKTLENWDTLNDKIWLRSTPMEYEDLNKYTSHIFDALDDSYIETKGPYDYYGVTSDQMYKALTPATLGGLVSSDLGRFHYQNAVNDLIRMGIENPTQDQVMQQFRDNIVAANNEKTHRNRKINELWKLQQQNASAMNAARIAAGGGDQSNQNTIIGFTDRVKYAISQQQGAGVIGQNNPNHKIINKVISGKSRENALYNWSLKTVIPQGYDQQLGAKQIFYGYTEKSPEFMDAVSGAKKPRFTFVPNSGLHLTSLRVYDHNGVYATGSSKSFDDYLHKHHVYGYPVDEPISITNDAQGNSNIYDANGYLQVEKDQIEGYFKQRWTSKTKGRTDYSDDDYENYKKNQMRQLGIVENRQTSSKEYVMTGSGDDAKGVFLPKTDVYYTIPVTRTARITGLGQSAIDTFVDKGIMSGKELGEREKSYQVRDYKRKIR